MLLQGEKDMSQVMMRTGSRIEILRRMRSEVVKRAAAVEQQMDRTKTRYAVCMDELDIIDRLLKEERECSSK